MDEEFVIKQPTDRRLGNTTDLPPGPPGADFYDYDSKNTQMPKLDKDSTNNGTKFKSGRRTPPPPRVHSPPNGGGSNERRKSSSRRRSTSRNVRSPTPSSHRRRRSPSTRARSRYYSPPPDHHHRRRYDNRRRSPDHRRRSPPHRRGGGGGGLGRRDRERYRGGGGGGGRGRGRAGSSSNSRSCSPRRFWSPKRKPSTPPLLPPSSQSSRMHQQPPMRHHANSAIPPYGVMPPQMYGQSYGNPVYGTHQYGMPTHAAASFGATSSYGMQGPPSQQDFNAAAAYGQPSGTWGINEYGQQVWIPHNISLTQQAQQQQMLDTRSRLMPPVDNSNHTHVPTTLQEQQQAEHQHSIPSSAASAEANEQQSVTKHTDSSNTNNAAAATSTSKQDAVAQEAANQRDELKKQRVNYIQKASILRHELKVLKDQRLDLTEGSSPPSPTTQSFIDENDHLQSQIKKKVDTIENVIDMLNGIIRDNDEDDDDDDDSDNEGDNNNGIHRSNDNDDNDSNQESQSYNNNKREVTGPSTPKSTPKHSDRLASSSRQHSEIREEATAGDGSHKSKTSSSTSDSSVDSSSSTSDSDTSASGSGSDSSSDTGNENDDSPTRLKNRAIKSMKSKLRSKAAAAVTTLPANKGASPVYNYVFFDPEQHWCPMCNVFPKSARDFLNHLHSKEHMDQETVETPWHLHVDHDPFPAYADAPTKRVPVRGMEFLVPSSAWFCKLCNFWIGDLHCASAHLKSQTHSQRYEVFLKHSPDYETNRAKDRQTAHEAHIILEYEKQQQNKMKKEDEKPLGKKRTRKSDDKNNKKKKNKKHSKKHKKIASVSAAAGGATSGTLGAATTTATTTSSSSSNSSTSDDDNTYRQPKKGREEQPTPQEVPRKQSENTTANVGGGGTTQSSSSSSVAPATTSGRIGRWTVAQEGIKPPSVPQSQQSSTATSKNDGVGDDKASGSQQNWNTVQPVISESEKKLLEQLKGKLKHKRGGGDGSTSTTTATANATSNAFSSAVRYNAFSDDKPSYNKRSMTRGSRSSLTQNRRSMTRSRSRGRGGGGDYRNTAANNDYRRGGIGGGGFGGRRSRTRSRSRGRRRRTRSPRNRRSRSRDNRRRRSSRSRSRSRSGSISYGINRGVSNVGNNGSGRIEKPVVRHSEFRPRNSKPNESKSKKEASKTIKPSNSNSGNTAAAAATGKKLPFIGKMPVFKKQTSEAAAAAAVAHSAAAAGIGQVGSGVVNDSQQQQCVNGTEHENGDQQQQRPARPTAAQIQMAMMEDVYGNAPPFHPEAGMMIDYDELMPDPVQFANLITHGPPPPPPPPFPQTSERREGKRSSNKINIKQIADSNNKGDSITGSTSNDDADGSGEDTDEAEVLPPGIDESDTDHVPLPLNAEAGPQRELPSDLAEALDIIFPSDKPSESDEITDNTEHNLSKAAAAANPTMQLMTTTLTPVVAATSMDPSVGALPTEQIKDFEMRQDEHASQMAYLAKQGIHMVMIQQQQQAAAASATSASSAATSVSSLDLRDQPKTPMPDAIHPTTTTSAAKSILTRKTIALVEQTAMEICSDEDREEEQENQKYESIVVANGQKKIDSKVKVDVGESLPSTPNVDSAPKVDSTHVLLPTDIPMPQSSPPLSTSEQLSDEATDARSPNVNESRETPDRTTSPTESDLEELAMLGIDTNDMAAQCM